jgi:hypothetical protein
VWVSRSRTVISRAGKVVEYWRGVPSDQTRRSAKAGRNRLTGSSSWKRPSSYRDMSATEVTGLVIE